MSNLLWKYYLEDNVERFRKLLASGHSSSQYTPKGHGGVAGQSGSAGAIIGSPASGFGTSPRTTNKTRRSLAYSHGVGASGTKTQNNALGRGEVNSRDQAGLTILHRAVSSTGSNAITFALALIDHAAVDLYIQDLENGWTALHRALYFGNITLARAIMDRDSRDSMGQGLSSAFIRANTLIKIKDREGNSAFDVYNATIARRVLQHRGQSPTLQESVDDDDDSVHFTSNGDETPLHYSAEGDEMFAFGSNKNLTLGFGDEDDRQHPERINLRRPDHLLFRFYHEQLLAKSAAGDAPIGSSRLIVNSVSDLPAIIRNRPIIIQDVALSKLHSAIITTDPESNLYLCGFGPGGRLGTGDETTRFTYVCIEEGGLNGKKVVAVALGQNHSIAASSEGEVFTWGTNTWGQLGYTLPRPVLQDDEPINSIPRQIFGPLKRENILGVAASAIHSAAFTATSLFTWGKNEGQLGLMDSDSRSLEAQTVPRRVAASLFTSPIQMISAINRATICLLANHTVYVFTNYGYNNVKFPMHDSFINYHLNYTALTTRYESAPNHISSITSGGETIAAVSTRGDLFTINVNQKIEPSPTATSTTNPAKIRDALSQPQHVWSLRKGHWDGIRSVGVSENGSVIICTQAGAVWRRVRRAKIKDTYLGLSESKNKDYKFQRVPGLTKVAVVRSNAFGAYAALRKDCDVTRDQIIVKQQGLWENLAQLFVLRDLEASNSTDDESESISWKPAFTKEHFDPFKRAVLISPDLEADIFRHLQNRLADHAEYNWVVSTNLSETSIPVHGFMLAARSPTLREALSSYRKDGNYSISDIFTISGGQNPTIVFHGVDFLTILNLVVYVYTDNVIDVWHFTRHTPKSAFRYRQIRTEVMKLASKLGMSKLESAARLMSTPEPCLNKDFAVAFEDPRLFEDSDTLIELDNGELSAHSALLRQRCPFFNGLFNGRAAGKWLAGRREDESEPIRIDMKHIDLSTFELVLRYLYADVGTDVFDDIISADTDEFCDMVMDVMSVANELMLDRLSQICQQVLGRFVNIRNICQLVNTVAPCSVTEFKDAGLEYLCLQLEAMLENHLLDELEDDLLLELDEVVRDNQLACLPFAKSGKAELLLHERHPKLAGEIDEEKQRKIRDMAFRSTVKDEDSRLSASFRTRIGSVDDMISSSPSHDKYRRKSKTPRNAPFSPTVGPKDSKADLMFDMDEDNTALEDPTYAKQRANKWGLGSPSRSILPLSSKELWQETEEKVASTADKSHLASPVSPPIATPTLLLLKKSEISDDGASPALASMPWSSTALPSSKLDMKEFMAQASRGRTSTLSISLSVEKAKADAASKVASPKMSQKERKKLQQELQQANFQPTSPVRSTPSIKLPTPWQVASIGHKMSLKEVIDGGGKGLPPIPSSNPIHSSVPTLARNHRRTASPDTRFAGQRRTVSTLSTSQVSKITTTDSGSARQSLKPRESKLAPVAPYSRPHTTPTGRAEPSLQLSMADIIGQQKREQDLIKEAVAKRSLQEIQEEQAFQEWWDQESRRAQEEEEAMRTNTASAGGPVGSSGRGRGRGRGGKRGRGGGQRGRGDTGQSRGRGRGRGGGSDQ